MKGFTTTPIVARLKETLVKGGVLGAVDAVDKIEQAIEMLKGTRPCAFVMFVRETPGAEKGATGMTIQKVAYQFMVAVGTLAAGTGGQAKGPLMEDVRDQVKDVLVGFVPEGACNPIVYAGTGNVVVDMPGQLLMHGIQFTTAYQLRKENTDA
jgi:hypothetical protein